MRRPLAWLGPEARFLMMAGAADATAEALGPLVRGGFRWGMLLALATRERALNAVAEAARLLPVNTVPSPVLEQLQRAAMVAEFGAGCTQRGLDASLRTLDDAGVSVMLLKGAALAVTVYPAFTARPMSDVDLLVRTEDGDRAWEALRRSGWKREDPRPIVERYYDAHQHRPRLVYPPLPGVKLELHTALFHEGRPFALSADALIGRGEVVEVGGVTVRVPCTADSVLYACLHFAWAHEMTFGMWRLVRDVEALSAARELAPDLVGNARRVRGATSCYWALRLCANLGGLAIPGDVLRALRPPRPRWMLDRLERHYARVALPIGAQCPSVRLSRALWSLGILPEQSGHGIARPWIASDSWPGDAPNSKGRVMEPSRGRVGLVLATLKYGTTLLR